MIFFALGAFLGLSAGISPGPLLTLVISETLRYNRKEGIKVALAPLVTDLPIVGLTILVFMQLSQFNGVLAVISFLGAAFVAWLGYDSFTTKQLPSGSPDAPALSLRKGIVANFLSPHPYLFWATIGAPTVVKASQVSTLSAVAFLAGFYLLLVGSKVAVALLVAKSRAFIGQKTYIIIMKLLGIGLWLFAAMFVRDGVRYLLLMMD
jgi:threonine/homoserine/homoserine lactone efflux protein